MFAQLDVTPVSGTPVAALQSEAAAGTQLPPVLSRESQARSGAGTQVLGNVSVRFLRDASLGGDEAVSGYSSLTPPAVEQPTDLDPQVVAMREARIALLVRKAESVSPVEDNARFQILTMRMRALDRSFVDGAHEVLSNAITQLEESSGVLDRVRAKYGLK